MVKKSLIVLISFFLLILGGCAGSSGASAGKILPPSGPACPFSGKWTVLQELNPNGDTGDTAQQWTGNDVQFGEDAVAFDGHVWDRLSYKIKRVNAADYLMTKYISPSGISVPESRDVDVVTVYASSNFLGEVMKIDDSNMIFFVQNKDLLLKKVSDQTDSMSGAAGSNTQELSRDGNMGTSGVLLGLRIPSGAGYIYRTLWIAGDRQKLHPVLADEKLFFPRASGFWELNVQDVSTGGKPGNILTARNVETKAPEGKETDEGTDKQVSTDSAITVSTDPAISIIDYIGNDYAAVEKEAGGVNQLRVLPVDKLSSPAEIKISDLLGGNGLAAYLRAREQAAAAINGTGTVSVGRDEAGENFGLVRKNGHWVLVGRINYQNGGTQAQADFDLKIIPPANLVFYDTLALSWHNIKDRVPDALDAFTSPNKDIALVKTKNKITVYAINAEQLPENPLAEIDLQEGATVIMAEWATGSYVESWEKSFRAYGAKALSDSSVRMR